MNAHEVARLLLAGPDITCVYRNDFNNEVEQVYVDDHLYWYDADGEYHDATPEHPIVVIE